jgi:hypothetical protein
VSRKRVHTGAQHSREYSRQIQARLNPAPVRTYYRCGVCGEPHATDTHAAPGCHGLSVDELLALRAAAIEELIHATRHGAERDHLEAVTAVIGVVDARLAAPYARPRPEPTPPADDAIPRTEIPRPPRGGRSAA